MKSKIWPQRPRKWPLDLDDLRRGWVDFFKNYTFKISASSWEKWGIARFFSKTFKISNLCYFLAASEDKELENGSCKIQNRISVSTNPVWTRNGLWFWHSDWDTSSVYVEILAKLSQRKKIFYCKQPCLYDFQRVN